MITMFENHYYDRKVNQVQLVVITLTEESKLSANHRSINIAPSVITHCPPHSIITDLHSSLQFSLASH